MFDADAPLLSRLLRAAAWAACLYAAWFAVGRPGLALYRTHDLVTRLARENAGAYGNEARRAVREAYGRRAAAAGAMADPALDVTANGRTVTVVATGTVEARFAVCCALTYDVTLTSDRNFADNLAHPES